jgi:hypothetical protein
MEMVNRQPSGAGFNFLFTDAQISTNDENYFKNPRGVETYRELQTNVPINPALSSLFNGLPQETPQEPTGPGIITGGLTGAAQSQKNDPCAGNKGTINPNEEGGLKAGIEHISDRHIEPQGPDWINNKSVFTFGTLGTKGHLSLTKSQKEEIVLGMMQEAFEKGAVNKLSRNRYAYSYAPFVQMVFGWVSADFIGMDRTRGNDFTNVRTVVLRINNPDGL